MEFDQLPKHIRDLVSLNSLRAVARRKTGTTTENVRELLHKKELRATKGRVAALGGIVRKYKVDATKPKKRSSAKSAPEEKRFSAPRDPKFEAKVIRKEANDVVTRDGVTLFWGGWPSQWYPSRFTIGNITYNCAEQWMMAEKARFFGDKEARGKILFSMYPKSQKEAGRNVTPFNEKKWSKASRKIVLKGNLAKFKQNPDLAKLLKATGATTIGEASPYDDLWGIGVDVKHKSAFKPKQWKGSNWLGKVLEQVRKKL